MHGNALKHMIVKIELMKSGNKSLKHRQLIF